MTELEASVREMSGKLQRYDDTQAQVQGFIDQGLLVMGDNGVPHMNVEAVLQSERQSEMGGAGEADVIQPHANRRYAQQFNLSPARMEGMDLGGDLEPS